MSGQWAREYVSRKVADTLPVPPGPSRSWSVQVPCIRLAARYGAGMTHADIDPRDSPEYLTLSQAGKEGEVSVRVLQELIAERKIVDGVARTQSGHAYLHRDHSWSGSAAGSSIGSKRP